MTQIIEYIIFDINTGLCMRTTIMIFTLAITLYGSLNTYTKTFSSIFTPDYKEYILENSSMPDKINNLIIRDIDRFHDSHLSKYKIKKIHLARQIYMESRFKPDAYNKSTGASGLMQVIPYYWNHLLYRVDNGDLAKHIRETGVKNTLKYYFRVPYNVELGFMVLEHYINKHDGDVAKALLSYSHRHNTKYFKSCMTNRSKLLDNFYVKFVLNN